MTPADQQPPERPSGPVVPAPCEGNVDGGVAGSGVAGDGAILLAVDSAGTMWLYPNTGGTGTGTFGARSQVSSGWAGYLAIDVGSLTSGGTGADVLGVDPAGSLWFYPNAGSSTFGAPVQVGAGWTGYTIN